MEIFIAINTPLPSTSLYVCLPEFGVQQFHVGDAWEKWKTLSAHTDEGTPDFLPSEFESCINEYEVEFYSRDCGGMIEGV